QLAADACERISARLGVFTRYRWGDEQAIIVGKVRCIQLQSGGKRLARVCDRTCKPKRTPFVTEGHLKGLMMADKVHLPICDFAACRLSRICYRKQPQEGNTTSRLIDCNRLPIRAPCERCITDTLRNDTIRAVSSVDVEDAQDTVIEAPERKSTSVGRPHH